MKISYRLLAKLIVFITKYVFETNNVNELVKWLNNNEGYISDIGGEK